MSVIASILTAVVAGILAAEIVKGGVIESLFGGVTAGQAVGGAFILLLAFLAAFWAPVGRGQ